MVKSWAGVVRDDSPTAAADAVHANKTFHAQLVSYFDKYRNSDLASMALSRLVAATNLALQEMHAEPHEQVTGRMLQDILDGHKGPTRAQVHAFAQVFTNANIRFYTDEREAFVAMGNKAAAEEIERIKQETTRCQPLRSSNPANAADKPSFQEMLEETHRQEGSFSSLLFHNVLPTWGLTNEQFCKHLEALNEGREGKKTFNVTTLDTWEKGIYTPLRESMNILCDAFDIKPAEGQKMAPHEAMLWRISGDHPFQWKHKKGVEALKQAIADSKASNNHGPLVAELCESSGIPFKHMQDLLDTKQLAQWKTGNGHIEDTGKAIEFVNMVNPCLGHKDEARKQYNSDIFALVTGRPNDIDQILKEARTKGNPSGALFSALTGREGIIQISSDDIVTIMQKAGITDFAKSAVSRMRNPINKLRGTDIHETHANAILNALEERIKPLVEAGMYKEITQKQREECIDVLTGCSPRKMLAECVAGNMNIRMLVKLAYKRKGLHQQGEGSLTEQSGIWNLSHFLRDEERHLTPEVAARLGEWFKTHYEFDKKELRQVMALAEGVDLRESPSEILDKVIAGTMERPAALQAIYDQTGLTREGLADAAKVPVNLIRYSVTQASGGRLASNEIEDDQLAKYIVAIAKEVGLSKRRDQFAEQFSTVARQVALQDLRMNAETQQTGSGKI